MVTVVENSFADAVKRTIAKSERLIRESRELKAQTDQLLRQLYERRKAISP